MPGSGLGSPPRVRSRHWSRWRTSDYRWITFACAEQTNTSRQDRRRVPDHLRVCGADVSQNNAQSAWGGGITSACAEQTARCSCRCIRAWDHLRVCGADCRNLRRVAANQGSPPRVRSRPAVRRREHAGPGITSACAEQTLHHQETPARNRDHLRVCGADLETDRVGVAIEGSPPRVRSRRLDDVLLRDRGGITSACAEQTLLSLTGCQAKEDHLRVCGADGDSVTQSGWQSGSPPRVRSRPPLLPGRDRGDGITSACAEQTSFMPCTIQRIRDHLRVCGADPNDCF